MDTQSLPLFRKEHRDKMLAVSLQYVYSVFSVDDCEIEIYMGLGGSKTCGIVPGLKHMAILLAPRPRHNAAWIFLVLRCEPPKNGGIVLSGLLPRTPK